VGKKKHLACLLHHFLITYLGCALAHNIAFAPALFVFYLSYEGIFRAVSKALASDFVPEHLRTGGVG
jgi:predicted MFS family arabinose efflux permease